MKPSCSIFIPAFNAERTITSVVDRIPAGLWSSIVKLYVINDGSYDNTATVVSELAGRYQQLELVSFENNRGYGKAVCRGLEKCRDSAAEYIVCLHADGQYPPEKIPEFISYMYKHDVDVLQGSRHKEDTALSGGMPIYKYLAGKCLVWLENRVLGLGMSDYHSGFMFYSARALKNIPYQQLSSSFDFDLEMIVLGKTAGLKISELAIPTRYADEKSYLNPFFYGMRVLRILIRYIAGYYRKLLQAAHH